MWILHIKLYGNIAGPYFSAHLSRKLIWWALRIGRPLSYVVVVHTFQTSSPQKPLGQSKSNFIWSFYGTREWKFAQMVLVIWPIWPPWVKTLKIFFSGIKGWWPWSLVLSGARVLPSLLKWWPWVDLDLFYSKVKFGPLYFCMGKM